MVFSLLLSLFRGLVEADDFDGELDFVGLFVGIEFDEGLDVAGHEGSTGFDEVLLLDFFASVLAPFDGLLLFVLVVVSEIEDIGTLELEGSYSFDLELTAVEAFGCKDGDGFVGCLGGYFVDTSLNGFLLDAQGAQEG